MRTLQFNELVDICERLQFAQDEAFRHGFANPRLSNLEVEIEDILECLHGIEQPQLNAAIAEASNRIGLRR